MISQINFRNYKLFKKKQILEIKPLTILIGKNNTGKSAILKLPTLLEGSLSGRFSQPFELINNDVKIANEYKDIVYGRNNREVEFEILQKKHISDIEFDNLRVEIFIDENKPIIENWNCNNIFDLTKLDENNYQNNKINKVQKTFFEGLELKNIKFVDDFLPLENYSLPKFELNTDFIGAIRHEALKHYEYSSNISEKSGIDGSKLYDFLIDDYMSTDKKYFSQISNFIKNKFEGWELSIEVDGGRKDKPAIIYLENKIPKFKPTLIKTP